MNELHEIAIENIAKILEDKNTSIVYFLRCNEYIKVGTCKGAIMRRMADLQVGNPYKLELEWFIIGGNEVERKIHKKLERYWVRGEWHKIDKKEMLGLIKNI